MNLKLLSVIGSAAACALIGLATLFFPGGYDWNKDFISSLFHAGSETSRWLAIGGVLAFWASMALAFELLLRTEEFKKDASWIRMTGHGTCVYGAFIVTPMHDLMISITVAFWSGAFVVLLRRLSINKDWMFLASGTVCAGLLLVTALLYYAGQLEGILPWTQRISFVAFSAWLISLTFSCHSISKVSAVS